MDSRKVVLLDDGTATFQIASERNKDGQQLAPLALKKRVKKSAKYWLQGLQDRDIDSVCFFTSYDIEVGDRDSIVKNNFHYLRNENKSVEIIDQVYFLGSPIAEASIMTEIEYMEHMSLVADYFRGQDVVYVAHRREKSEKLNRIESELGFNVKLFDYPIEYQLALMGPRPKTLASFYSSALENCRVIFGNSMNIIAFRLNGSNFTNQATIDSIYDYYASKENEFFRLVSLH